MSIISKTPGGEDIGQDTGGSQEFVQIPAISRNGSHILMTTEGGFFGTHMYMRVDDSVTYDIANGGKGNFIGMTANGSKVFFSSREKITPDDTDNFSTDIFMWDEATNKVTRISQGNGQGNGEECEQAEGYACSVIPLNTERPDLDDVVSSQSGDIYFFSPEQLDPNNPGVFNEKNLYVYHEGKIEYVATFDPGTTVNRIQISPDGQHAAFLTAAKLTSYDNHGWREMYKFDPGTGVLQCVSCNPTGAPPVVRPPLVEGQFTENSPQTAKEPSGNVLASQSGRFMSDDGRVAFTTSDPLVEADTNGIGDVYEFVNGRAQLISSGTAQRDKFPGSLFFPALYAGLEAVSTDGTDIYFSTVDTLAPGDINGDFIKFYDARSGGGFGVDQAQLPCVAADECHGEENPARLLPRSAPTHRWVPRRSSTARKLDRARRSRSAIATRGRSATTAGVGNEQGEERTRRSFDLGGADQGQTADGVHSHRSRPGANRPGRGQPGRRQDGNPPVHDARLDLPGRWSSGRRLHDDLDPPGQTFDPCNCEDARVLDTHFPTGFIGDPHAIAQCSLVQFTLAKCPVDSQVGVLDLQNGFFRTPIFNMIPHPDEPGLVGFPVPASQTAAFVVLHGRTGGDYGLDATSGPIYHLLPFNDVGVHLWGVPADHSHDVNRFSPEQILGVQCEPYPGGCFEPFASVSPRPRTCRTRPPAACRWPRRWTSTTTTGTIAHAESPWPATTGCDS